MVKNQHIAWKFPNRKIVFLRIEIFFILLLAILIFVFGYFQMGNSLWAAMASTVVFLALYGAISYFFQKFKRMEHFYHLTPTHLQLIKKDHKSSKSEKIHLKDVKHHKVDKLLLGGYVTTHKGKKHLLYFNKKIEAEKFSKLMRRHIGELKKRK